MSEETITKEAEVIDDSSKSSVVTKKRKKAKKTVTHGRAFIQATFNNTIVTIADQSGNVLTQSSAGACGFRGSKKGTAYAAQIACEKVAESARSDFGMRSLDVFVNGIGLGRDSAVRSLAGMDLDIKRIVDTTGVPHGGCRAKRVRRV